MRPAEIILWGSIALIAYAYLVYPIVLGRLARRTPDPTAAPPRLADESLPSVTLLIAAYREESVIVERIQNALMLDYPANRLEILIGCDGEEDLTGRLANGFQDSRVRVIQFPERRGKASVLNDCVPRCTGDIVVFSDANTMMRQKALRKLVRHFQDFSVGGVCGKLLLVDSHSGKNVDGLYWRYENYLKQNEGRWGALLGVNGGIYAIRKELYVPLASNTIVDDFVIGMRIHQQGRRLLYDDSAVAVEDTPPTIGAEFHRRTRIGAGGFQSIAFLLPLLNPGYGRVAFAFWSHKVLRWICPAFMIAALVSNMMLIQSKFYSRVLLCQELFYVLAIVGLGIAGGERWKRFLRLPSMFVSMNAALLLGFVRWMTGQQGGKWRRTERAGA